MYYTRLVATSLPERWMVEKSTWKAGKVGGANQDRDLCREKKKHISHMKNTIHHTGNKLPAQSNRTEFVLPDLTKC